MIASFPQNETARLNWLRQSSILDTPPEALFDDITRLAAQVCGVSIAAISLIDEERQWFKSIIGLPITETPRDIAFCAHTLLQQNLLIVSDTRADYRFADNPLVTGDPNIRFYAGAPLVTSEGFALGSLCIVDLSPRQLTPEQGALLEMLARQVAGRIELQRRIVLQDQLIAECKRLETDLRQSEAKFRSIIDLSPMPYALNDEHGNITFLNAEFIKIFGYTLEDIPTLADWWPKAYPDPEYRQCVAASWLDNLEKAKQENTEFEALELNVRCKNGKVRTVMASAAALGDSFAGTHLVILCDITERKQAEQTRTDFLIVLEFQKQELEKANAELEVLATQDDLTGLQNRRAFDNHLEDEFERASRSQMPLSLLLIDIDYFKLYNDTFGHLVGDEALRMMGSILRKTTRGTDILARYGGEEFAVILPTTDREGAMQMAERIRASVEAALWKQRAVTVSLGVCVLTPEMHSPAALVAHADAALYCAKAGGRNRVVQGDPSPEEWSTSCFQRRDLVVQL